MKKTDLKSECEPEFSILNFQPQYCRRLSKWFETLLQVAGNFPNGLKPCCRLQETIVEEHQSDASCREQLLRNISLLQLAGENC